MIVLEPETLTTPPMMVMPPGAVSPAIVVFFPVVKRHCVSQLPRSIVPPTSNTIVRGWTTPLTVKLASERP